LRVLKNPGATVKAAPAELKTSSLFRSDEIGAGLEISVLTPFLDTNRCPPPLENAAPAASCAET
jgi:hypothetical protein